MFVDFQKFEKKFLPVLEPDLRAWWSFFARWFLRGQYPARDAQLYAGRSIRRDFIPVHKEPGCIDIGQVKGDLQCPPTMNDPARFAIFRADFANLPILP